MSFVVQYSNTAQVMVDAGHGGQGTSSLTTREEGINLGVTAIFTGKLRQHLGEAFVLDVHGRTIEQCVPACDDDALDAASLEKDLFLEECSGEEEGVPHWSAGQAGRMTGRRLMQARAQECVVCLIEKEHTFVPPHLCSSIRGAARHGDQDHARWRQQIQSHRFCTECWAEYLQHEASQQQEQRSAVRPRELRCPLCREAIAVPEVWRLHLGLSTRPARPLARRRPVDVCPSARSGSWGQCWGEAGAVSSRATASTMPQPRASHVAGGAQGSRRLALEEPPDFWAVRRPRSLPVAAVEALAGPSSACIPVVREPTDACVASVVPPEYVQLWRFLAFVAWQTGIFLLALAITVLALAAIEEVHMICHWASDVATDFVAEQLFPCDGYGD